MAKDPTAHRAHALSLARFIDTSPSPFHVVQTGIELLEAVGYEAAEPGTRGGLTGTRYLQRDGSLPPGVRRAILLRGLPFAWSARIPTARTCA